MASTPQFQNWARVEAARRQGRLQDIDAAVDAAMKQIKIERRIDGKWQEWKDADEQEALEDAAGQQS